MTNTPQGKCEVCGRDGGKCVPTLIDPECKATIDLAKRVLLAAVKCPHEIDSDSVVLLFDKKQPGVNALSQLSRRIAAALCAPQPPKEEA